MRALTICLALSACNLSIHQTEDLIDGAMLTLTCPIPLEACRIGVKP